MLPHTVFVSALSRLWWQPAALRWLQAKLRRSIENLICEMNQMLGRYGKASIVDIRCQYKQPFGKSEWASSELLLSASVGDVQHG
jgi:hypothetical protein